MYGTHAFHCRVIMPSQIFKALTVVLDVAENYLSSLPIDRDVKTQFHCVSPNLLFILVSPFTCCKL